MSLNREYQNGYFLDADGVPRIICLKSQTRAELQLHTESSLSGTSLT